MDYKDISDSELHSLLCENEEDATDILFTKYKYIIDIIIKKYIIMAKRMNIQYIDLYQDAVVGFIDALNGYQENKDAALPRFITICVERKIQSSLIKASRKKNKLLNESLSLEHVYEQFKMPLKDIISDESVNDPLLTMTKEENYKELVTNIKKILSPNEYKVFTLMINNLSYIEIATILNKSPKQIDNTMQRIKNKVKTIINE